MSIFTRIQFDDEVLLELHFDQTEIVQKDIRWYVNPHTHTSTYFLRRKGILLKSRCS